MILTRFAAAAFLICLASPVVAQTFGPPIKGVCLLSRTSAIGASRANQSLQAELKKLKESLSTELAKHRAALSDQQRALDARQDRVAPIEYQRQKALLDLQMQQLDHQLNSRFIAAQARGQQQVDEALNQALARVITRSACSFVMERDNTYGWNNAMDVTDAVTQEMNSILSIVAVR